MDPQTSRKIVVGSGMALVVGLGALLFGMRSHQPTSAAQIGRAPDIVAPPAEAPAVAPVADSSAGTPTPAAPAGSPAVNASAGTASAEVPAAVAHSGDTSAAVAATPIVSAAAHEKSGSAKKGHAADPTAVKAKVAGSRRLAKAGPNADTSDRTAVPSQAPVASSEKSADQPADKNVDAVTSVDELKGASAGSGTTSFAEEGAANAAPVAPDAGSPPK